ncbi:hypothetical protein [Sphingobacterium sp. IITKGP-BTPF85]|uniref:hypothetical protein n=1 Tax=Sphingobacterium sp. IITKGP-BTPF85 TaxID=1338009 RepID=UPI000389EB60|nr:hypothetical protein [Sphingobacterium sp. IITKGP-BTPF85]
MVDEVLYRKPTVEQLDAVPLFYKRAGKRAIKKYLFLERFFGTFAFKTFKIRGKLVQQDLLELFGQIRRDDFPRVIYYIDTDEDYLSVLDDVDEHAILIIEEPHASKNHEKYWNLLKQAEKVVVTIDLFHLGLVFFKKGQRKEDFVIRF